MAKTSTVKKRPRKNNPADDLITYVSVTRDMLRAFGTLVAEINRISSTYKVNLSSFGQSTFKPEMLSSISPEQLGFLMSAMLEASDLGSGIQKVTTYDVRQLKDLENSINSALEKFDKALE